LSKLKREEREKPMNQAEKLISEANEHRERAYIRGVDGVIVGDDPIYHALADLALSRLHSLQLNAERHDHFEHSNGSIPDEPIHYSVEPPLEFCERFTVPSIEHVDVVERRFADFARQVDDAERVLVRARAAVGT
jgi:hypothetical protein